MNISKRKQPWLRFCILAAAGLTVSCIGGPSSHPEKVVVSCSRSVLSQPYNSVAVVPFETVSSSFPVSGQKLADSFSALLPDLGYTVKPLAISEDKTGNRTVHLKPGLVRKILADARSGEIDAVVFGSLEAAEGVTTYTVVMKSTVSAENIWTVYGENVSLQRMVDELKKRMFPHKKSGR